MKTLQIDGDLRVPTVNLNHETGILELSGRSTTENVLSFYEPIVIWLEAYLQQPAPNTVLNVNLDYINTSSSMWIGLILKKLELGHSQGKNIIINWYYADEYMLDTGQDYEAILSVPFQMIEIDEE